MKKYTYLPAIFALAFLVTACTMPAVKGSAPHPDKEKPAEESIQPEKPAATIRPETKGKRVSLIPKEDTAKPAKVTPQDKTVAAPPPDTQPAPPQPQPQPLVFTDYNTGLSFTYQRPWHLVSTQGEGPVLGRDGHSQLTARFATLTTNKDKGAQKGYFYAPEDSLTGTIGTRLKTMLGLGNKQITQEKTPIDVLLTQKHFPNLIIEKRYRGNNGGVVVQKCRHKQLPGQILVQHIFIEDKVASFSLSEVKNRQLKLEMQQIVLSTRKP
ncbi:MAG: hypothetical protein OEV89_07600 [Desulfobulbaceae bacterium]|nr:hypothetical protein [Desulfobulbaceae bacterium]HIJ90617.1 hypothetical protein [Deltaproteobacteria bacterium]